MFVGCTEKTGFSGFGFSDQGDRRSLQDQRRLPEGKCNLQDQRMAFGFVLNRTGKSKTEIPGNRPLVCRTAIIPG